METMNPTGDERYSRQIRFPGIGAAGQDKLRHATVAIVGCGALGSFQAGALARAGAGRLLLIDRDCVEWSNLQRQWLYGEDDAANARPKAAAAAAAIARINSEVQANPLIVDLTASNAEDLLEDADLILDGTDNFETRYLMNDVAVKRGVPWIYGGAVGSYGLGMAIVPEKTACFRCVYPNPPGGVQPTCETAGVVNTVTSAVASVQVSLGLRLLTGGAPDGRITTVDVWSGMMRTVPAPQRDLECDCCVRREFTALETTERTPVSLCGRNAVQIHERSRPLDLPVLEAKLAPLGDVRVNEFALRFFLPGYEMTIFPDGRAIVKGTTDPGIARSLYARYVGA
jgi:molybdopterin/thiamine biosynthesis adenylyltransferase